MLLFVFLIILVGALNTLTENLNKSAKRERNKIVRRSTSFNRLAKKKTEITKKEPTQNLSGVELSPVPHIAETDTKNENEDNLEMPVEFFAPTLSSTMQFENSSDDDDDYATTVSDSDAGLQPAALPSKALIVSAYLEAQLAALF